MIAQAMAVYGKMNTTTPSGTPPSPPTASPPSPVSPKHDAPEPPKPVAKETQNSAGFEPELLSQSPSANDQGTRMPQGAKPFVFSGMKLRDEIRHELERV